MVCIHLKRGVEESLNYYLLPKLYVKLWLCPSVNLIYMHSFPQSRLLYLSPWKNACCPGCVPDHHENGRCIPRSCILNVFVFVFSYGHSCYYIRIVTATCKATKIQEWNSAKLFKQFTWLRKIKPHQWSEVLLPHSLWFLKSH